ncbi:hypothetical protein BGX23_001341 [Mortierella sp. AD031]|nr:hypothetical protein BGX23_001341 [Mortierella sp. AD031]
MTNTPTTNNTELPALQQLAINATDSFVVQTSDAPANEDVDMNELFQDMPPASNAESSATVVDPAATFNDQDLSAYSIMSDAEYNGDTDLSADMEEVLLSKRTSLEQWTKVYRHSMLRVERTSIAHPMYATWKMECGDLEKVVRQKQQDVVSFAAALSMGDLSVPPVLSSSTAATTVVHADSKKLSLDLGTPRFGDPNKYGKGQPFQVIADPHLFLDSFKTYCESSYGEKLFLASATRLLRMAILDEQTRQQFNDEMVSSGTSAITWDECEVAFVDSVLTPTERFRTVARVAQTGRRFKESYRNFALRLQRSVRVYRIDDNNATVPSGIMGSIPSLELNLIKNSIQKAGTSLSEVKLDSICDVLTALSAMEGPDDSLKRPHSLVDNDSDDDKSSPSSKFDKNNDKRPRYPNQRGNGRRDKGKTTTNSSSASSSSSSTSNKKTFHCDNHGENTSHATKDCRICSKCNKFGHTAPYCRNDCKKNFDNKGKGKKEDK